MKALDKAKATVKRRVSNLLFPYLPLSLLSFFLVSTEFRIFSNEDIKTWLPIKIEKDGAVFRATACNGNEWFIPSSSVYFALFAFTFIEKEERYLDATRKGDIVVEVGACTGEYTIPAAQRVGEHGRVLAFEADPIGCECTKRNARLYNLNNIEVINEAVSDIVGRRVSIDVPGLGLATGFLVKKDDGSMVTTTLDKCLKDSKVDVLKMTVNGHELEVLMGANKLLKNVRSVVFQSAKHKELISVLKERGFKVRKLEPARYRPDVVKTALLER